MTDTVRALPLRGIHYDIGTATIAGDTTRPWLEREQMEREIADIAEGLHANAIRITGDDLERMRQAAEIAADHRLEIWLSPMLPNADATTTAAAIAAAADIAEVRRSDGDPIVLVVGCELSAFMDGILPGVTHGERLALLSDMDRLVAEVTERGLDPQARFDDFLAGVVGTSRSRFRGPLTYAAGTWETVDWSTFDIIGIDAYRDSANRSRYADDLRDRTEQGQSVVVTEFGCATYAGAADRGSMAWDVVDRTGAAPRLDRGIVPDEAAQAAELADQLDAIASSGVDGAFIYTYIAPSYPASDDPAEDLDAASFALVRSWSDGLTEPKAAYRSVAERFGSWAEVPVAALR